MREIKFRDWCKSTKKWLEPDQGDRDWPMLLAIGLHGLPICIDKDSVKDGEIIGWNRDHNIELSQFTGLIDKNGVDVYESDILSVINKSYSINGENKIVKLSEYDDNEQYVEGVHLGWNVDGYLLVDCIKDGSVVIGNIHENPELLCAKK